MTHVGGDEQPDRDVDRRLAEKASEAEQRAERARENASAAQRSAAASLRKSAECQERIARLYVDRAEESIFDDDSEHAARHEQYARDDRAMAERLRQSADAHLARGTS